MLALRKQYYTVDFDGSNDHGKTANAQFNFERTDAFSVALWFRTTATGIDQVYIGTRLASGTTRGWEIRQRTTDVLGFVMVSTSGTDLLVADFAAPNDGYWHCFSCTYDGSSTVVGVTLYLDGSPVTPTSTTDLLTSTIVSGIPMYVGSKEGPTAPFAGRMGPISIWNKELSAAEAWAIWNLGVPGDLEAHPARSNLIGYWRMGESGVWPHLLDESGYSRHLTMINMLEGDKVNDYILGSGRRPTKCLDFAGAGYVSMGNVLGFEYSDPFALSCWFKTSTSTSDYLISKRDGSSVGYGLMIRGDSSGELEFGLVNTLTTAEATIKTTTTGWNDGAWHHVVATSSGAGTVAGLSIYVDGELQGKTTVYDNLGAASIANTASFNLGARTDGAAGVYTGRLVEAEVHDRVLTLAEVEEHYNDGWGFKATELSTSDALVGYWRPLETDGYPTVADASYSGNNGTMSIGGPPTILGDAPAGTVFNDMEGCLGFATNAWSDHGNVLGFEYTDTFSIAFWMRPPNDGATYMFGKAYYINNNRIGWSVTRESLGYIQLRMVNNYGTGNRTLVSSPLYQMYTSVKTWFHVVICWAGNANGSGAKIYIDGVQVPVTITTGLTGTVLTTANFTLGNVYESTSGFYGGKFSHMGFYDKVLSDAEVEEIFSDGRLVNLYSLSTAGNILAYFRGGDGDISSTRRNEISTVKDSGPSGYDGPSTGSVPLWLSRDLVYNQSNSGLVDRTEYGVEEVLKSFDGGLIERGENYIDDLPRQYFRMRGWNTSTLDWETWTSADVPNMTPPVGPCVDITIETYWS